MDAPAPDSTGIRLRDRVPPPPRGRDRVRWWGPGLLWAMSAVGSGSVLFTPRVGSQYGYELLWLLWGVALLMWVMIREAGRFAVLTGRTLLDGFSTLPGPRNWALWVVFVPQVLAAVVGIAGLSALVGSALAGVLPGDLVVWSLVLLTTSTALVVSGGYRLVQRVAMLLAFGLVAVAVVAAGRVFPAVADPAAGLVPGVPADLDVPFVLPWIGTILAGSMGIIWYSYWAATRGYGGGAADLSEGEVDDEPDDEGPAPVGERAERFAGWLRTMSTTAAVGVLTGTIIITSFLVLGAELLRPEGIVPSGVDVADELARLLEGVWGRTGFWLMTAAIVVALGGSVIANQDGWSRSFADIALLLPTAREQASDDVDPDRVGWLHAVVGRRPERMGARRALKILFAVVLGFLVPAVVVVAVRDPVAIMSVSGVVGAVHTPFIVVTTLILNRRLPATGRPGRSSTVALGLAGAFYTAFALLWFADALGVLG